MNVQPLKSPLSHPVSKLIPQWTQNVMWLVFTGLVIGFETRRWLTPETRDQALTGWLSGTYPDFFPYLPFLILFTFCWWGFSSKRTSTSTKSTVGKWLNTTPHEESNYLFTIICGLLIAMTAFGISWWVGTRFENLPPAYHDEYSYLIQAETYLLGRWSNPEFAAMPELFDQMHVLNEGRFASRYFPGTGAWMAPYVALGIPWTGHQVAQALCALLIFLAGRELANNGTGLLAGVLFAVSPGLVLFSNLLLAHHPTMLGLCLFLWAFIKAKRTTSLTMFCVAGTGLSFAMLCRPMTAAAFGFPFGVVFIKWWITGTGEWGGGLNNLKMTAYDRTLRAVCLGMPLLMGFLVVFVSNKQITGNYLVTPYQQYLDIYTPRHVYGFNNVVRGERKLGPKVLSAYDEWAENLTPKLAIQNVKTRIASSLRWSLGIVPLTLAFVIVVLSPASGRSDWWLIIAAIICLHIAHIPYWFEGIMGWHYVFETAALWALVMAEASRRLFVTWQATGHRSMSWVWSAMLCLSIMVNHVTLPPVWAAPLDRVVPEVKYPREIYANFRKQIDQQRAGKPAIVFVIPDPSDRSMDYVTNSASLSGDVLIARLSSREQLARARALFSDRIALLFNASTKEFERIDEL